MAFSTNPVNVDNFNFGNLAYELQPNGAITIAPGAQPNFPQPVDDTRVLLDLLQAGANIPLYDSSGNQIAWPANYAPSGNDQGASLSQYLGKQGVPGFAAATPPPSSTPPPPSTPPPSTPSTGSTGSTASAPANNMPGVYNCPPGTAYFAGGCWNVADNGGLGGQVSPTQGSSLGVSAPTQMPASATSGILTQLQQAGAGAGNNASLLNQLNSMTPSSLVSLLLQLVGSGMSSGAPTQNTGPASFTAPQPQGGAGAGASGAGASSGPLSQSYFSNVVAPSIEQSKIAAQQYALSTMTPDQQANALGSLSPTNLQQLGY